MREPIIIESGGGEYMESVTVVEWLPSLGEKVTAGQHIVTVETAKASTEVEAVCDGVLLEICANPGDEVQLGSILGYIGNQEAAEDEAASSLQTTEKAQRSDDPKCRPAIVSTQTPRSISSPLARRIAFQNSVDLSVIRGSGPNGRIIRKDVERAITAKSPAGKQQGLESDLTIARVMPHVRGPAEDEFSLVPHTAMRRAIAARLTEGKQTIPHFYVSAQCLVGGSWSCAPKSMKLRPETAPGRLCSKSQ